MPLNDYTHARTRRCSSLQADEGHTAIAKHYTDANDGKMEHMHKDKLITATNDELPAAKWRRDGRKKR